MNLLLSLGLAAAVASYSTLPNTSGAWFRQATAIYQDVQPVKMAAPDYLPGTSVLSVCHAYDGGGPFIADSTWELVAYDRPHGLFLAAVHNDECGLALFKASPAFTVPRSVHQTDLTGYRSARGLQIGSTYSEVLRRYGGPVKHGAHFVVRYSAVVPARLNRAVSILDRATDEHVTLVIDGGRVSSIVVQITENG